MVSEALITHRDGIVGAWQGPVNKLHRPPNSTNNLELWEPWVRAELYDFALFSHLHMTPAAGGWFVLRHLRLAGPAFLPLVWMRRPSEVQFRQQLNFVNGYADLREDRTAEITAQAVSPIAFWTGVANLHPDRMRWTLELIWTAMRLAGHVEQRFKHALACRRPLELSPQVQPMILTPGHGSLPSGHATEAHIVAHVLARLVPGPAAVRLRWREQLMRQAARIAINRTVAGVHFPVDSAAGQLLGLSLGEYLLARCGVQPAYRVWRFNGPGFPNADFDFRDHFDVPANARVIQPWAQGGINVAVLPNPSLQWLWGRAVAEWT